MAYRESLHAVCDHGTGAVGSGRVFTFCVGKSAACCRFLFRFFIPRAAGINRWSRRIPGRNDHGRVDGSRLCLEIQEESAASFSLRLTLGVRVLSRSFAKSCAANAL